MWSQVLCAKTSTSFIHHERKNNHLYPHFAHICRGQLSEESDPETEIYLSQRCSWGSNFDLHVCCFTQKDKSVRVYTLAELSKLNERTFGSRPFSATSAVRHGKHWLRIMQRQMILYSQVLLLSFKVPFRLTIVERLLTYELRMFHSAWFSGLRGFSWSRFHQFHVNQINRHFWKYRLCIEITFREFFF